MERVRGQWQGGGSTAEEPVGAEIKDTKIVFQSGFSQRSGEKLCWRSFLRISADLAK